MDTPQSNNKPIENKSVVNRLYFCPRCHRRIDVPPFLRNFQGKVNIKTNGKINVMCGYCKKGKIQIELPEQPKQA